MAAASSNPSVIAVDLRWIRTMSMKDHHLISSYIRNYMRTCDGWTPTVDLAKIADNTTWVESI